MIYFLIVLLVLVLLAALYILSTVCRKGHPGLEALRGWAYAHRGLHDNTRPENSMSAFRAALQKGYGIELDIHLLADGELAVIHDSALKRTTGAEGRIEDLTAGQLSGYYLEGTLETIPTFKQVLELYNGKAPLIVELKPVDFNHAKLCQAVCDLLDSYNGVYCLESFDPQCVRWLRKNRPDLIRGQLSENFFKSGHLSWILSLIATSLMTNFLTRPDFVAYKYADRHLLPNVIVKRLWGVQTVTWTLTTPREYANATKEGYIPIFEGFTP